jgi:capsular polysaccharide transport system ATP-binding protein
MIEFDNVTKTVRPRGQPPRDILSAATLTFPADRRIALLGQALDDRLAVIDMIAGIVLPTYGRIVRNCRVSYPVGFLGGINPELSVRVNVAHAAKLHDVDPRMLVEFVERTAAIGVPFDKTFGEIHNDAKRQLGIILSFALPFDLYLMKYDLSRLRANLKDNFRARCYELFEARARSSGMIIAVTAPAFAREYCDAALVLHRGRLLPFDDVEEAFVTLERLRYSDALAASAG